MISRQDFLNAVTQDIDIVKGDTLSFNFQLTGLKLGTPAAKRPTFTFSVADEQSIFFTATSAHGEEDADGITLADYNESKDVATYVVYIAPTKTKTLDLARYYYDLQMELGDDVYTLMRGRFTLLREVTV